jgi:hypothetical protein
MALGVSHRSILHRSISEQVAATSLALHGDEVSVVTAPASTDVAVPSEFQRRRQVDGQ